VAAAVFDGISAELQASGRDVGAMAEPMAEDAQAAIAVAEEAPAAQA